MIKKTAIPVWNNIISPLFDSACSFVILANDGNRESINNNGAPLLETIEIIKKTESKIIICGAISSLALNILTDCGISVISGIRGEIENVIAAHIEGSLTIQAQFMLPGCRGRNHGQSRNSIGYCGKGKFYENSCNGHRRK